MRPGGSKRKGNAFERQTGAALSQWLTNGARNDLFARTVLSGGQVTRRLAAELPTSIPGDLMANHPEALEFCSHFSIECKHRKDLELDDFLYRTHSSWLGGVILHTAKQAKPSVREWLVIAKANKKPTLWVSRIEIGETLRVSCRGRMRMPTTHVIADRYFVGELEPLLMCVNPRTFLAEWKKWIRREEYHGQDTSEATPSP